MVAAVIRFIKGIVLFWADFIKISVQLRGKKEFKITGFFPCVEDRFLESGNLNGPYFYQDLHVSQKIFLNRPLKHVDIGSKVDGFIAHVASFREIEVFDIRPNRKVVKNIKFTQKNIMEPNLAVSDYCDSISSLHAIEHFGLGRYGDKIDIDGHIKGLDSIYRTLKKAGVFYFSVPIGPQRIEFNAHRVFNMKYLLKLLEERYRIKSFSLINDNGDFVPDLAIESGGVEANFSCQHGCGIFELIKL